MLIHLESDGCDSDISFDDLDQVAFECYQSKKYSTDCGDEPPYFYPGRQAEIATLAGLFQEYTVSPGCLAKLQRFIQKHM